MQSTVSTDAPRPERLRRLAALFCGFYVGLLGLGLLTGPPADPLVSSAAQAPPGEPQHAVAPAGRQGDGPLAQDGWRRAAMVEAPEVHADAPDVLIGEEPLVVSGRVFPPDAVVLARGAEIERDGRAFTARFDHPLPEPLALFAVTAAGRSTVHPLEVTVVPSRVAVDGGVRALHVSFWAWVTSSLRDPVLELAEGGRISAVQLDLKDESGLIGYDTDIPLAHEAGTAAGIFDLEEAVAELHSRDIHVIGRIVAFADPAFTAWAWEHDRREAVVQTPDGERYTGRYAGFTNPTDETVRAYNLAVAEEAARAGVDAILWDYIRRPDGSLDGLVFPGFEGDPIDEVTAFVAEADELLAPYGVEHGVSVFGIAATRPRQIAQDVEGMAEHVDYLAPMLYPSHWGPGEYGVADPNRQPYDIVTRSLGDFLAVTEGTRARVVPWLQDFSLGATYGEAEVRAQLEGAADAGVVEWIMWDPHVRYTREAYDALGDQ